MSETLTRDWRTLRAHPPTGEYLPIGQHDGDCAACGQEWPCEEAVLALATFGFRLSVG